MIDYRRLVKVWINDILLQTVAPLAVVQTVTEPQPEMDMETADAIGVRGSTLARRKRKSKEVKIGIIIGNQYDLEARAATMDAIASWAKDGILKMSYRPNQRLRVSAGRLPAIGSVREWTQMIEVSLVAYALPYWEGIEETAVTLTAEADAETTGILHPMGTAEFAPCAVTITNTDETVLSRLTVSAGSTQITLSGLEIASGGSVTLYHDDNMLFRIQSNGTELANLRTSTSSDELIVTPGADNTISITADADVDAVFSSRGLWV